MKILILRFSSIGDVLQTLSVAGALGKRFPEAEIHWATRSDLKTLVETHPCVKKVFDLDKGEGLSGLLSFAGKLKSENYSHIYDAHNNLRSRILCWVLVGPFGLWGRWRGVRFIRRSIPRWKRFLLFRLRKNFFEQPFSGQRDLLDPLKAWNIPRVAPPPPQLFIREEVIRKVREKIPFESYIALAPSAAYELKRWPLAYWKDLIRALPTHRFVVLGGPADYFLKELEELRPERVVNRAGQLSLEESAAAVANSQLLIANDTGVLHMAEQLGKDCIALMGPAPFGFPSRPKTKVMELDLSCRPCSKHGQGPCVNPEFHKCLADIRPSVVLLEAKKILKGAQP